MPKYVYPVYETDAWHSLEHRECKGIYTSKQAAVNAIVKNHNIEDEDFYECIDGMETLTPRQRKAEIKRKLRKDFEIGFQTQGYTVNYDIEVWLINDWA